jgi:hypothetical protein
MIMNSSIMLILLFAWVSCTLAKYSIVTYAGGGLYTYDGVPATTANLVSPWSVFYRSGNGYLYCALGSRIRYITTDNKMYLLAGNGSIGYSGDGGLGSQAMLKTPRGVCGLPNAAYVYITDTGNHCIRRVELSTGIISWVMGTCGASGASTTASFTFASPLGCVLDTSGNLYIADTRKYTYQLSIM